MPIFDQGYQHWSGELSGHSWRWLAITRNGLRSGLKNRMMRYVLYFAWVPALVLVVMLCLWGLLERKSSAASLFITMMTFMSPKLVSSPQAYRVDVWRLCYYYFLLVELYVSMLIILLVGPSLISQDLRFNALPLYFSRPLRRIDYFVGKLGIIVVFLALVVIVPSIVAYIFGLFFSLDLTIVPDTFGILLKSITFGLIVAFSAGLLMLALSALSRNSRYVALLWVSIWLLSTIGSQVLQYEYGEQRHDYYYHQITATRPYDLSPDLSRDEAARRRRIWIRAREKADEEYAAGELNYTKKDWRPLVSYNGDLLRMAQALLSKNDVWRDLSLIAPQQAARDYILAYYIDPEFPWYWSFAVLLGLFGLSACILTLSVKSLDRLK